MHGRVAERTLSDHRRVLAPARAGRLATVPLSLLSPRPLSLLASSSTQTALPAYAYLTMAIARHEIPPQVLSGLSQTTRTGLERLRDHQPELADLFVPSPI